MRRTTHPLCPGNRYWRADTLAQLANDLPNFDVPTHANYPTGFIAGDAPPLSGRGALGSFSSSTKRSQRSDLKSGVAIGTDSTRVTHRMLYQYEIGGGYLAFAQRALGSA